MSELRPKIHRQATNAYLRYWGARRSVRLALSQRNRVDGLSQEIVNPETGRNEYGVVVFPASYRNMNVPKKLRLGEVHEKKTFEFIMGQRRKQDIVHAGTFIGTFLPGFSSSRQGDAKIWAFEPNTVSFRCAEATTALNGLANVSLFHGALGEANGTRRLEVMRGNGRPAGPTSKLVDGEVAMDSARTEETEVFVLDQIIPSDREVGIIQLDLEGGEQAALEGAMSLIQRCKPLLIVETLPSEAWRAERLESLGYEVSDKLNNNYVISC